MSWPIRCVRRLGDWLLAVSGVHERRVRRRVQRDLDRRLAAWKALPREEQLGFIHPASPQKPRGWTLKKYRATQRRRDEAS